MKKVKDIGNAVVVKNAPTVSTPTRTPIATVEGSRTIKKYKHNRADLTKSLISLEILEIPQDLNTVEEVEAHYDEMVEFKTYLIDDTTRKYGIRLAVGKKKFISATNPEMIPESDTYEISESIQDILRENNLPVFTHSFPEAK